MVSCVCMFVCMYVYVANSVALLRKQEKKSFFSSRAKLENLNKKTTGKCMKLFFFKKKCFWRRKKTEIWNFLHNKNKSLENLRKNHLFFRTKKFKHTFDLLLNFLCVCLYACEFILLLVWLNSTQYRDHFAYQKHVIFFVCFLFTDFYKL